MSETVRLYFDDPFALAFDARVVAHGEIGGARSIVLDRSALYPESGGQLADHGAIGGVAIVDVQLDDAGRVHHLAAPGAALPAIGAEVRGSVDRARRRLHMALHTGQHMLSRALVEVAGLETVSARLGESSCTIDADAPGDERRVAEAEALVNAIIDDDRAIRAYFPSPDELAALPLRRAPKVSRDIRVVAIDGFDVTPCGGTHCTSTAQVGLVQINGTERYKGKLRVSFSAGKRARSELWADRDRLAALARTFTCGVADVASSVSKLQRELQESREIAGLLRGQLAEQEASGLASRAQGGHAIATYEGASIDFLRAIATRVASAPGLVVFLAARAIEGTTVLVARGESSRFDCGAFVKRAAASAGGRGGGRPERAEGRLPSDVDWPSLVRATLAEDAPK